MNRFFVIGDCMNLNGKKVLSYAGKLCVLAMAAILIMKLLGRDIGDSVMPLFLLAIAANVISYMLYKPKK